MSEFLTIKKATLNPLCQWDTTERVNDVADLSGINGDTFVLRMSYDENAAQLMIGGELGMRLAWFNPATQKWENAVDGNTGGTPVFAGNGAYNPAVDYHLGFYGVDTANNEVWAVVNHNSNFGVTTSFDIEVVPEPTNFIIGAACAAIGLRRRRRYRASRRDMLRHVENKRKYATS